MWVLYGILPPIFVIGIIVAAVVAVMRVRAGDGRGITFSGVLLAYVYAAMLISVFLTASGSALLIKSGLSEAVERDFSYEVERYGDPLRDDIAAGVTLVFVGLTLFAVHAVGGVLLRRRRAQGERFVSRAYNLLGLAGATLGFLIAAGTALYDTLRRYVLSTENLRSWEFPRPGEPIAVAVVFLPLVLWFGWRVWQEFALAAPEQGQSGGGE